MRRNWFGYILSAFLISVLASCGVIRSMGRDPEGDALTALDSLANYKNGGFQNQTSNLDSATKHKRWLFLKTKPSTIRPSHQLPWVKTDLKSLKATAPTVVWFGHSSLLIKTQQGNVLIDPVFSDHAGPIPGVMTAFPGTTHYHAKDMPPIDVLIISHDHYDHLDYRTLKKLKDRIKLAVVPLGIGSDLIYWGFDRKKIIELNWDQSTTLSGGLEITATPAQHKSNRSYSASNKTLWASFVIRSGRYKIYYSGDSGYSSHFKKIGEKYGPFDLALLECGQYSPNWPWTHLLLGQSAQAATDLKADMLQPIHWAKFEEADHPWNEPIKKLLPAAEKLNIQLNVPRIGEPYTLGRPPKTTIWWDTEK
ncbi:MBL fold metallo-hydrolase [Mucilaginibacter daejeonensis]|uniref:MBL fold metallo-hydrolase n=1 Tax=Mucilaginibacter daejeonensis TaxID=398049 RepID=UPI001D175823|nr:MBL fold metallo-hydrolase [Mucilaginibacter daejeonensis]UEG54959.1 MBL fold metallo-hydrolase [Mucilaginibacter daejeonensis]